MFLELTFIENKVPVMINFDDVLFFHVSVTGGIVLIMNSERWRTITVIESYESISSFCKSVT